MFAYILVFKNKENSKKKSNIIAECKLPSIYMAANCRLQKMRVRRKKMVALN